MMDERRKLIPAATLAILREIEGQMQVLLLKRSKHLSFGPGAWVFPGGKVDCDDHSDCNSEIKTACNAALRETHEEAGLVFSAEQVFFFSHWYTPKVLSRLFSTWFFITQLHESAEIKIDEGEVETYEWVVPIDAIRRHQKGQMELMPPTFVTLLELHRLATVDVALAHYQSTGPRYYKPKYLVESEQEFCLYEGDAGYDIDHLSVSGPRHRLRMAPLPWRYSDDLESSVLKF